MSVPHLHGVERLEKQIGGWMHSVMVTMYSV